MLYIQPLELYKYDSEAKDTFSEILVRMPE